MGHAAEQLKDVAEYYGFSRLNKVEDKIFLKQIIFLYEIP